MTHTTTKQASIGDTGATAIATKSRNAPMLNNRTTYFTGTEQQRYMREQLVQVLVKTIKTMTVVWINLHIVPA